MLFVLFCTHLIIKDFPYHEWETQPTDVISESWEPRQAAHMTLRACDVGLGGRIHTHVHACAGTDTHTMHVHTHMHTHIFTYTHPSPHAHTLLIRSFW